MKGRLRDVAAKYGEAASAYERYWAPVLETFSAPLIDAMPLRPGARLLDVGAGVGTIARLLERTHSIEPYGVDLTHEMLARATGVQRAVGDIMRMPFAQRAFDAAICTFVLQHIPSAVKVMRELARVLRRGAHVGTATWSAAADESGGPYDILTALLDDAGAPPFVQTLKTYHSRVDAPPKLRRAARTAGLTVVRAWEQRVAYPWTPETFLGWATTAGWYRRRFEGLDDGTRTKVVDEARARIGALSSEEMTYRPRVVYMIARA